jgi:hypothetical protein
LSIDDAARSGELKAATISHFHAQHDYRLSALLYPSDHDKAQQWLAGVARPKPNSQAREQHRAGNKDDSAPTASTGMMRNCRSN